MKRIYSIILISGLYIFLLICSSCARTPGATFSPTSTNTPTETVPPSQNISKQQLISEVMPLLEAGTSEAYAKAWNKLRLVGNYKGKYWDDEEIQALLWFSYDMINVASGRQYTDNFSFISPDYEGVYHEQISAEVLKHISRDEWVRRYETNSPMLATVVAKDRQSLP
jgi:hypothetical protein